MKRPVDGMQGRVGEQSGPAVEAEDPAAAPFEVERLRLRSMRVGGVEQTDEYGRIRNGRSLASLEGGSGTVRLIEYLSAVFPGTRYAVDADFGQHARVMSYRTEPEARAEFDLRAGELTRGTFGTESSG